MIDYFFKVAELTSLLSTCCSQQVGAVLVKDNRIVAIGFNGTAPGESHCNEKFDLKNYKDYETFRNDHHKWSRYNELHAEQNLISFCAKNGLKTKGCTLFVTLSPCIDCAKIIVASGIKDIYYINEYDKENGLNFLKENGISINF